MDLDAPFVQSSLDSPLLSSGPLDPVQMPPSPSAHSLRKRTRSPSPSPSSHRRSTRRLLPTTTSPCSLSPPYPTSYPTPPLQEMDREYFGSTLSQHHPETVPPLSFSSSSSHIRDFVSTPVSTYHASPHFSNTHDQSLSLSQRNQTIHIAQLHQEQQQGTKQRASRAKFTMGFRQDCEKCRLRIPNHYAHVN